MAKLVQDEAGQIFVDEGGGVLTPVTEDQARTFEEGKGAVMGAGMAATQGLNNLSSGLLSLFDDDYKQINQEGRARSEALSLANPVTSSAAQYLPQVAAGVATGGMGPGVVAGTEALLGAATTPETPLQGAALGALLGGAGELAGPAAAALYGRGKQLANRMTGSTLDDALAPGIPRAGSSVADDLEQVAEAAPQVEPLSQPQGVSSTYASNGGPPQRMADRVTAAIDNEARSSTQVAPTRVAGDLMSPDELAEYGVPLNRGQAEYLTATTAQPGAATRARAMMADDEARRSSPAMGRVINENIAAQQEAGTNFIGNQLGVPTGVALTDGTVSTAMANIGNRLDAIAEEMGGVPITKEIRDEVAEVMRLSAGRHTSALQTSIDNALKKADNNGGMLVGQDWQVLRTDLTKQIEKGMKDGKIDWVNEASDVMDTFTRAMESRLPTETQRELRKLRKQYAIGATLSKPGTRNADGLVNPTSFYSNWKRPQSLKKRGHDDVGRFMNTINFLTQKRIPDSGTATRLGRMAEGAVEGMPVIGGIYKGMLNP